MLDYPTGLKKLLQSCKAHNMWVYNNSASTVKRMGFKPTSDNYSSDGSNNTEASPRVDTRGNPVSVCFMANHVTDAVAMLFGFERVRLY